MIQDISDFFRLIPIGSVQPAQGVSRIAFTTKLLFLFRFAFTTKYSFRFHKYKLDYSMDHLIPQTSVYTFARSQFNKNFWFYRGFKSRAHIRTQLILLSAPLYTFTLWWVNKWALQGTELWLNPIPCKQLLCQSLWCLKWSILHGFDQK